MEQNKKKNKKKGKKKFIIAGIIIIIVLGFIAFKFFGKNNANTGMMNIPFTTDTVQKQDITAKISGTGTLQPADSYSVITLVGGQISGAKIEEGDMVDVDSILYEIDSTDAATVLERAQITYEQTQKSYNKLVDQLGDLVMTSEEAGTVTDINVKVGDKVQIGQTIATVRNSDVMSLSVPFLADDVTKIEVGAKAEVIIDGSYEKLEGIVSKIKNVEEVLDGYRIVKNITIDVKNPGGLSVNTSATATIGDFACINSNTFTYKSEIQVTANTSGEIKNLSVNEGDKVNKNQIIASLASDDLTDSIENSSNSLRDAELNLEAKRDQLDEYTLKSPIKGQIIQKDYKEGDRIEAGKTLCTIFDLSYLTMILNVDELDISNVKVGQDVSILVDALDNKSYTGKITKININGNTANGITSYPVTIRIDETEGLLPGMNVDVSIDVLSKNGVLAVPVTAVARGNRVLVKNEYVNLEDTENVTPSDIEGYSYVKVVLGISNDAYIEIVSGIKEGDEIAITEQTNNDFSEEYY